MNDQLKSEQREYGNEYIYRDRCIYTPMYKVTMFIIIIILSYSNVPKLTACFHGVYNIDLTLY